MVSILIADDDRRYSDSIKKVFEREGYQVECASDVGSALKTLHAHPFDLIVCDYRMPGRSGLELLEELQREHSKVPVVMISACVDAAMEARALELGAVEVMKKPVRRRDLIDRAARVMGGLYVESSHL
jgi:DNA-binding response OmpR family regulator